MPKERHRSFLGYCSRGVPLIVGAAGFLASLPSSSAEENPYYGRLSRDYQSRESRRQSGGDGHERRQSGATGYFYGQQPLVHTFETQGSCSRRCPLPCVVQNVEDLMMPRWICPSQQSSENSPSTNAVQPETSSFSIPFDNQLLLLIVPLALILFIILVIIWVRRSSSSSSGSNDDELV